MKTVLSIAVILALGASPALAKATYCKDPTTHKRISCKVAPAKAAPAKSAMMAKPTAMAKPATSAMAPADKPAAKSSMMASAKPTAGHKGIKCGNSYIAANKVCHKK